MARVTEANQAGGYYTRLKPTVSANFSGNNKTFHAFSAKLGERNGQGFTHTDGYVLTEVETNYKGELEEDFWLEGVGIEVIPDSLDVAGNASAAFEFLTKTCVVLQIDSRQILLGPAYQWPSGHQPGNIQYKPAASSGLADASMLVRFGHQRHLAEPIFLEAKTKPVIKFLTNDMDPPAMPSAQVFVDVRLFGSGREPVRG